MCEWPVWSERAKAALCWPRELADMLLASKCQAVSILDLQGRAPPAKHAWGNTLAACPCGCRSQGLPIDCNLQGGFAEAGAFSGISSAPRSLHPKEAALLNMSLRFKFERGLKEGLCLVGALTAPTQALWIFAQLGQWAAEHFHDLQVRTPFWHCKLASGMKPETSFLSRLRYKGAMSTFVASSSPTRVRCRQPLDGR